MMKWSCVAPRHCCLLLWCDRSVKCWILFNGVPWCFGDLFRDQVPSDTFSPQLAIFVEVTSTKGPFRVKHVRVSWLRMRTMLEVWSSEWTQWFDICWVWFRFLPCHTFYRGWRHHSAVNFPTSSFHFQIEGDQAELLWMATHGLKLGWLTRNWPELDPALIASPRVPQISTVNISNYGHVTASSVTFFFHNYNTLLPLATSPIMEIYSRRSVYSLLWTFVRSPAQ